MLAFRLTKAKYVATAFDGEGARLFGGRWNSVGTRVVYLAGSLSLAALEILVHSKRPEDLENYVYLSVSFTEAMLTKVDLPDDWQRSPAPVGTQRLGDAWVLKRQSLLLEVPSVVIPEEKTYLLNPEHPDFVALTLGEATVFPFDSRLWRG